jgi:hypothetical protein
MKSSGKKGIETDAPKGITRRELLKHAAVAAPLLRAGIASKGKTSQGLPYQERYRISYGPGTGDPAFPRRLGEPKPPRPDPTEAERRELRERLHQRMHVLAGPLHANVGLFPGAAWSEVYP